MNSALAEAFNPATFIGAMVYAAVFAVFALIGARVIRFVMERGSRHLSDPTATAFIGQFLQVIVVIAALILYAHVVPQLRALGTALLTGASVSAIVLGLAAQNTLGNLVAGLGILLYHPFRLGDYVEINTPKGVMSGTISALTLGYTTILATTRQEIIVPNSVMASAVMIKGNPAP